MSETTQLIIGIGVLILVVVLTRRFHAWRFKRVYLFIIDDLKKKAAYSAHSAVELPYAKKSLLRMGARQQRPPGPRTSHPGKHRRQNRRRPILFNSKEYWFLRYALVLDGYSTKITIDQYLKSLLDFNLPKL